MRNTTMKNVVSLLLSIMLTFLLVACNNVTNTQSYNETEIIVHEETIIEDGDTVSTNSNTTSKTTIHNSDADISSSESAVSSTASSVVSTPDETISEKTEAEWKSHPQDYKLLAFTFDDGPSNKTMRWVELFSAFDGAGTFFVNGYNIKGESDYKILQNAINAGWDIGNHGANHLVATTGGANGGNANYKQLKADITDFSTQLNAHLKKTDGTPYEISLFRPPNIAVTDTMFEVCCDDNLAIIWLSQNAMDYNSAGKTEKEIYNIFKNGIGTWADGDIILSHEWADFTYNSLEELLGDFYRAGYRFCSITELMRLRGISHSQISGRLNNVAQNNGMVTNLINAADFGKNY